VNDDAAAVFGRAAADYDTVIPFFRRFGERLVEVVGVGSGDEVLDVAAGRGATTFPALSQVGDGGRVVATDAAEAMVRHLAADLGGPANASAHVMDAQAVDYPDESFDVVLCAFGVMFLPDRARALAEWRRVLRPGGRVGISVPTGANDEMMFFGDVARTYLGRAVRPLPAPPAPFELRPLLEDAGFVDIEEVDDAQEFTFSDEHAWWAWLQTQGQRVFLDVLPPDAVDDLRDECFARLRPHRTADGYLLRQRARYTTAHR
jgi:O-methyltransferase/aklanonic acid methyltransferase